MTNSSWTQAHITSLLNKGRKGFFASVLLIDEKSLEKNGGEKGACEVVFPPCDTGAMRGFGLDKRSNEIISLAQFRCVAYSLRAGRERSTEMIHG